MNSTQIEDFICPKCGGSGWLYGNGKDLIEMTIKGVKCYVTPFSTMCLVCEGSGKVDWVRRITWNREQQLHSVFEGQVRSRHEPRSILPIDADE